VLFINFCSSVANLHITCAWKTQAGNELAQALVNSLSCQHIAL